MELRKYIDHTILKPEATAEDVHQLCKEAMEHQFAAVCVNPCYVKLAAGLLAGTKVKVATVIGFPLGANLSAVKAFEGERAALQGADEIDMVINIGAAKAGMWDEVLEDIKQVVAGAEGCTVKVIVETALLTEDEKKRVCQVVLDSGAHYIKTSTGFSTGGAAVADIELFKSIVGEKIGIKASGGIRTREDAMAMIEAGATRIGTSGGVKMTN